MKLHAIVLAAGSSRRMGRDKLLLRLRGEHILTRSLTPLLACSSIEGVSLVVRPGFTWPGRVPDCALVVNPDHERGMGSSLAAGVRAAPAEAEAYLVALADMPDLSAASLRRLIEAFADSSGGIVRPTFEGRSGHPVILGRRYRGELLELDGDVGARELLDQHRAEVIEIEVDDPGVIHDIDRPADLDQRLRILVRGAGEMATGVAHQLFTAGYQVVMTDRENPTAIRRPVVFASALQRGEIEVEGVLARACRPDCITVPADAVGRYIPVMPDPECRILQYWRPDVFIDGRMRKRRGGTVVSDAPLVIALGPGFTAGVDADVVVETNRGHDLARLIRSGEAEPNTSTPGTIAGQTTTRVLRAPADGIVEVERDIGDLVVAGDVMGRVDGSEFRAGIDGVVRGMIHPGYVVVRGQKIGDVDPRGRVGYCSTISEKARAIGGASLLAVAQHLNGFVPSPR